MLRRHDARHGHAGPFPRALSPPLRHRHARSQRAFALSGGDSAGAAAGPGLAAAAPSHRDRAAITAPAGITPTRTRISARSTAVATAPQRSPYSGPAYNSIDNIAEFFASRGKKFSLPKVEIPAADGAHWIPARTARPSSEIWRRHGVQARRRRGRCEDYGTIS